MDKVKKKDCVSVLYKIVKAISVQLIIRRPAKKFPHFMEPESSSPRSCPRRVIIIQFCAPTSVFRSGRSKGSV